MSASENLLLDVYKVHGPKFVTWPMAEMARVQHLAQKRMKELGIAIVASSKLADKVRENNGSEAETETARQLEIARRQLSSNKPEIQRGGFRGRARGFDRGFANRRGFGRGAGRGGFRIQNSNDDPNQMQSQNLEAVKCFNCNLKGHFARDCPKPQRQKPNTAN